jgi:trk system potassium uptake protein TrkH
MERGMRYRIFRVMQRAGRIETTQLIVLAFAAVILVGAGLLCLPTASRAEGSCGFLSALFTATSATCVTGLAVGDTYSYWTGFGQTVILVLIQIGGLGVMTAASVVFFLMRKKLGFRDRMLLAQSLNLTDFDGVLGIVRHVLLWTAGAEGVGAVLLSLRFSFDVGPVMGIRWGVFHAISAFCNAGFDLFGYAEPGIGMALYQGDWFVCLVVMALIMAGGLGFFVWEDLYNTRGWKKLQVYSKLVLVINAVLFVGGTALFLLLEWGNPETLGTLSVPGKMLAAMFQSVTLRTAGFAGISQTGLTQAGKAGSVVLMLIGGSSGSTAGGLKTVTTGLLILAAWSVARGRSRVHVFGRSVAHSQIYEAMSLAMLMMLLCFGGAMFLSATQGLEFLDCLYEAASAIGTVGLTTGMTPTLSAFAKVVILIYMFFGRIGIMTISLAFLMGDRAEERYSYAETRLMIG